MDDLLAKIEQLPDGLTVEVHGIESNSYADGILTLGDVADLKKLVRKLRLANESAGRIAKCMNFPQCGHCHNAAMDYLTAEASA